MTDETRQMTRRNFIGSSGALGAGALLASSPFGFALADSPKTRLALVGTGIRGITFWGQFIQQNYADTVEFVGLCDINPGRLAFAKSYIGVPDCPTFTNFDEMLAVAKPDLVMVTTVDNTHDEFIVKALNAGINVVTEKPMTTTADKCQSHRRRRQGLIRAADHGFQLPLRLGLHQAQGNAFGRLDRGGDLGRFQLVPEQLPRGVLFQTLARHP